MTHSRFLRDMARLLRIERQLTVDQLAQRLALPRSTVYYWVRDLPLRTSGGARGGAAGQTRLGARRVVRAKAGDACAYAQALQSFDDLAVQPTFRDFLCVYIVDGYKRDRRRVALANADPAVMRLASRWIWRLTDRSPSLSVTCEPEQSIGELRRYWSDVVGERANAIRARRVTAERAAHRQSPPPVHGVLKVAVDDALLRARMQAWMRRMRDSWR